MREQRVKTVNFDVCKKPPKLIGYHSNVPWTTAKTYVCFVIPIHTSTRAETLVKIGPVVSDIFGEIGRLWPSHPKNAFTILVISEVTGLIFIIFAKNVANVLRFGMAAQQNRLVREKRRFFYF